MKYDFIIIGGGLGGLVSGAILSKHGYSVSVLEKSPKIGGCLQSYHKDGGLFETGVHYIGSMSEGQTLNKIFKYLDILPKLSLKQMDINGFDRISFEGDDTIYYYAQGYENFISTLSRQFPQEHKNIVAYCDLLKLVCDKFPLYKLVNGSFEDKLSVIELDTFTEIEKLTTNYRLQNVLAGNNPLYTGVKNRTPFYIHALIQNSYIESAWKLTQGGSQIAHALVDVIKQNGGEVKTSKEVIRLIEKNGKIEDIITSEGETLHAHNVISGIHPVTTFEMIETNLLRNAFYHRLKSFENTIAPLILNVTLKKPVFGLDNHNRYHYLSDNVWSYQSVVKDQFPGVVIIFPTLENKGTYSVSIMTSLPFKIWEQWHNTYNTFYINKSRGTEYEELKMEYTGKIVNTVEKIQPGFSAAIDKMHIVTGLTYRDHTGIPEGSFYGISKDCKEPFKTFFPTQTKITNLHLTGQNVNVHGVYGVMITALNTVSSFINIENLLQDIQNA